MPLPEYDPATMKCSIKAFEFKALMGSQLELYLDNHPGESKKTFAGKLEDASSADLSHWLSFQMRCTMHGHLVPLFCQLVGDNSLNWHLQEQYEAVS